MCGKSFFFFFLARFRLFFVYFFPSGCHGHSSNRKDRKTVQKLGLADPIDLVNELFHSSLKLFVLWDLLIVWSLTSHIRSGNL